MIQLEFPEPLFNTRYQDNKAQIFDEIRSKWVSMQPEEWVRQNFIKWMLSVRSIPPAFISIEKTIQLGLLSKRFDLLVYDRKHLPWMMVECKAQGVVMDESVLRQILRYNLVVPVRYIVITNGDSCFVADKKATSPSWLNEFPEFPED